MEQLKVYHDICLTVSVIPKAMTSYPNCSWSTPENEGTPEASRVRGGGGGAQKTSWDHLHPVAPTLISGRPVTRARGILLAEAR